MPLDDETIRDLTRTVWETVLGLPADEGADGAVAGDAIRASVDIRGEWVGTVSLSFSHVLARKLTAAMLAMPEDEATADLVRDVSGELANVIGGNVKGLLPGRCSLSVPRVEGAAAARAEERRVWFYCAGEPFVVAVFSGLPE